MRIKINNIMKKREKKEKNNWGYLFDL